MLLAWCVTSQTKPTGLQPASNPLTTGPIQLAQEHLRAFGFDPRPVQGLFTAETQAAVGAYQARYGLPVTGCSIQTWQRCSQIPSALSIANVTHHLTLFSIYSKQLLPAFWAPYQFPSAIQTSRDEPLSGIQSICRKLWRRRTIGDRRRAEERHR